MTTAAVRRRLAELETALAQITTKAASADGMSWIKWTTFEELTELESLYRDRAEYEDLDDLTKARVLAIVATVTAREIAAKAHSPDLRISHEP